MKDKYMSTNYNVIPFNMIRKRTVVMILATSIDYVIGHENKIPWSCKTDMQFFKKATTGNIVIMGRNTFESLNSKPLPNRVNIVISTTLPESTKGVIVVRTISDAIIEAQRCDLSQFKRNTVNEHVFVIGGGKIYEDMYQLCDEILHSSVSCDLSTIEDSTRVSLSNWIEHKNFDNEILYYNKLNIGNDKYPLKEIVHYFKELHKHKFELKDEL